MTFVNYVLKAVRFHIYHFNTAFEFFKYTYCSNREVTNVLSKFIQQMEFVSN